MSVVALRQSRRAIALAVLVGGGLLIPVNVSAAPLTATFQYGGTNATNNSFTSSYNGAQDTYIDGGSTTVADYSYGGNYDVTTLPNSKKYALLKFDLSSIPANSITVLSATLTVTSDHKNESAASYGWYAINSANADWKASLTTGALETTGAATYNNKASFGVNNAGNIGWNGGPGLGVGTATPGYDTSAMGSGSMPAAGGSTTTANLLVSTVQSWIDNASTNGGMIFLPDDAATQVTFKQSSETGVPSGQIVPTIAQRPKLVITYEAVPEPASLSLLALGGLLLLRKRREA